MIIKLLLFPPNSVFQPCSKRFPPLLAARLPRMKKKNFFRWCYLKELYSSPLCYQYSPKPLCYQYSPKASVQSIFTKPLCNQFLTTLRATNITPISTRVGKGGGGVWGSGEGGKGKKKEFGHGAAVFFFFLWYPCTSNLTTNDEGRRELVAMATWNSSRHREAVFNILDISLAWLAHDACRLKTFGPYQPSSATYHADLLRIPITVL